MGSMNSILFEQIRRLILRWYDQNKRALPWRKTRDPYAIWISETMLQQTQVQTVIPYYRRFLKLFPTLRALDRAPADRVMALWSGLGYYRRAENIKRAARLMMTKHKGAMPREFGALRALPGLGDYTAGAVASIAFNQAVPALDGNARRVLQRVFVARNRRSLNALASDLISLSRPGDFNQALMDLGSAVCTPRDPACGACPCRPLCRARRSGRYETEKPRPQRSAAITWPLGVIAHQRNVLLRRRAQHGLLAGLWEVPGGKQESDETARQTLARQFASSRALAARMKLVGEARHSITRYKIRAPIFFTSAASRIVPGAGEWRWVPLSSVAKYPLSSLSIKALRFVASRLRVPGAKR